MPKTPEQSTNNNVIENILNKLLWLEKEVELLKIKTSTKEQTNEK